MSYQQLHSALPAALERIASFCGVAITPREQAALATHCSFAFMKRHESRFDHAAREPDGAVAVTGQFIRKGQTGGFTELFGAEHERRFCAQLTAPIRLPTVELRLSAFLQ